jgi:hypothetical protein
MRTIAATSAGGSPPPPASDLPLSSRGSAAASLDAGKARTRDASTTPERPGLAPGDRSAPDPPAAFEERLRTFAERLESVARQDAARGPTPVDEETPAVAARLAEHLERLRLELSAAWPSTWPPDIAVLEALRSVAGRIGATFRIWRGLIDPRTRRKAQRRARALRRGVGRARDRDLELRRLEALEDFGNPRPIAAARDALERALRRLEPRLAAERMRALQVDLETAAQTLASGRDRSERAVAQAAVRLGRRRERALAALVSVGEAMDPQVIARAGRAVRKWRDACDVVAAVAGIADPRPSRESSEIARTWDRAAAEAGRAGGALDLAERDRLRSLAARLIEMAQAPTPAGSGERSDDRV